MPCRRHGRAGVRRSAIWTTTATRMSWSATSGRRPTCCATMAATSRTGSAVRTIGTRSNRDGIGSQVRVVTAAGPTSSTSRSARRSGTCRRATSGCSSGSVQSHRPGSWRFAGRRRRSDVRQRQIAADAGCDRARRDERAEGGPMITRRTLLAWLAYSADTAFRQGMSSRSVKPQPRGKPSGRPFQRAFHRCRSAGRTDAADRLRRRRTKSYIVEVVGCGVAFLDYDNDGWLDVFVLSGTRLEGAPPGRPIASTRTIATAPSPT